MVLSQLIVLSEVQVYKHLVSSGRTFIFVICHDGPYQADSTQIYRRKGSEEAAGHQGRPQERPGHRWREEAASLQARHGGSARDPSLPEEHRAADPQAAVPASGPRNRSGFQDRSSLPELCRDGPSGGQRGLPGRSVRGYQPVRHPRQARDHHAQGHPACPPYPWRACLRSCLLRQTAFFKAPKSCQKSLAKCARVFPLQNVLVTISLSISLKIDRWMDG